MDPKRRRNLRVAGESVLAELEALARGNHPSQQEILRKFDECKDWQKSAALIVRALHHTLQEGQQGPRISAPPGWLPPLS